MVIISHDNYYQIGQVYCTQYATIVELTSVGKCNGYDVLNSRCQFCNGEHLIFDNDNVTRCPVDNSGKIFFTRAYKTNEKW